MITLRPGCVPGFTVEIIRFQVQELLLSQKNIDFYSVRSHHKTRNLNTNYRSVNHVKAQKLFSRFCRITTLAILIKNVMKFSPSVKLFQAY